MTRASLAVALAAVALVAAAAFVRAKTAPREGPDLKPRPDALEYGVSAAALAGRGVYELPIGDAAYPPRYPPGFALLAAPVVALRGGDPSAARDAAFLFGLLDVLVVTLLGALAAGLLGALVAGAVVALSPLAIDQSVLAMSETASAALVGAVLLAAATAAWRRPPDAPRRSLLLLAGLAAGVAVLVRYTNLAVLLPVLLFFGTRHALAPGAGRKLPAALAAGLPALAAVLGLALYNAATFGSALSDGYRFWKPAIYERTGVVFSPRYLAQGIPGYWEEGHLAVYGRALLGSGRLWGAGAAALAAVGLVRVLVLARRCPVARLLALAAGTTLPAVVLFHLVYFWQDPRFFVPLLPLLAVLAGAGAEAVRAGLAALARRLRPGPSVGIGRAVSAAAGAAVLGTAVGGPAAALLPALGSSGPVRPPPPMTRWLPTLDAELPRDSIVICNFPVTLAIPALGRRREVIVTNRHTADPHLGEIAEHHLRGKDGRTPGVRALAAGDRVESETLDDLVRWVREGRPAYYVAVAGEAAAGAGVSALAARGLETVETLARPPITVYELRRRR